MRIDDTTTVDRGRYPDAATPWQRKSWRAEAFGWVADRLTAHGLRPDGALRVRLRPWSVLVRIPVSGPRAGVGAEHGGGAEHRDGAGRGAGVGRAVVWFKANPPASAFEGPLTAALARWVPEHVLRPLAVEAEHGWTLLPDGGDLFRAVLGREQVEPRDWEALLRQYGSMQNNLVAHAAEIERLGVPAARTRDLPQVFDKLLAANRALTPDQHTRLEGLRPRLADWCAELASAGIPDTLDHADLHDGQLFRPAPGRFTFFDWGDATVSHPFCSLRVPLERACDRYGPQVLPRLLDAYLEPWTDPGRTAAELRRAAELAWRLSALGRAASWGRMFPDASGAEPGAAEGAAWLLELLGEPPFRSA
ncbi:aminoglycoside phosphotransferase family protein [Streptomyces sp. Go40/10]|uniref:aminoglycoside phosphotransferase family protein n=1 Tax=Streptomyces sp. Go40/10 TaxID=2825844 RepID=UPI001E4D0537|nr:aminoglycoside phosphotransferase family protein [Streptomyces sp. Go40/10]UFR00514.1 aminoglycoside phosphotransferase family protein [Streptomyces sp. Go40/10]